MTRDVSPSIQIRQEVWDRERRFHDEVATKIEPEGLGGPDLGPLELALLEACGPVQGLRVLDAGCGQGDLTLWLLEQGAKVTALDLSPGMIDVVRRRVAAQSGLHQPEYVAEPLEETGLAAESVDLIVGRFILHHTDLDESSAEVDRILAPGGRALFIENQATNPLLRLARDHLTGRFGIPRYGTPDEHPLRGPDYELLRRRFPTLRCHHPVFDFFAIFDRQVLRYRRKRLSRVLSGADRTVERLGPRARSWSYRVIVELSKPGRRDGAST